MNSFYKNIIFLAVIVLIFSLTLVGVAIANDEVNIKFPPRIDNCPDYWAHANYLKNSDNVFSLNDSDVNIDDLENECVNIQKLGVCSNKTIMDFDKVPFNNSGDKGPDSGMCAKYKWAKQCKVTWDGITNNDDICNS
ncbi:hypothetical protein CL656_07245 [bacterium]|nr:hypothetical protein [bacterium]